MTADRRFLPALRAAAIHADDAIAAPNDDEDRRRSRRTPTIGTKTSPPPSSMSSSAPSTPQAWEWIRETTLAGIENVIDRVARPAITWPAARPGR